MDAGMFRVEARFDRESASDGVSRFGAYLRDRARVFREWDGKPTSDPVVFAVEALLVALPPVMSPGYVVLDPRVLDVGRHRDDDDRVAVAVTVVWPLGRVIDRAAGTGWRTWRREHRGGNAGWVEPYDNDRPVVLPTVQLRVPIPADVLPTPAYVCGVPNTTVAKMAVGAVCLHLNRQLAPLLDRLDGVGVVA